jgi:peptidoglycan/LPS O-acetylase OafA/YrhL
MGHNMPAKWDTWFSPLSSLGMPLFFTLSGFLMAYNYSAGFQSRFGRTLRSYLVARFARIYPVYALCLLLSFSFMGGFFNDLKERPGDVRTSLLYLFSMTQSWAQVPVFQDYGAARTKAGRGGQRTCGRNDSAASRVIRMTNGAIRRAAYPSPATGA